MTIDLGILKLRLDRNYVSIDEAPPLHVRWTLVIGLATPSLKFFPMAWNLLALDKLPNGAPTLDFIRIRVDE